MKLHTSAEFQQIILATSSHLKLRPVYIEKDYWLTYALKRLARSQYHNNIVFKGGTCLSKAYKIIKRFSEDIDLALIKDNALTSNQIRTLIKKIEKSITDNNFKSEDNHELVSKGSKFRKTVYSYPQTITGDFGQSYNKLVIEINSFANPHPFKKYPIISYIGEFLQETAEISLIEEFELGSFELNILSLERTFAEKILALVRASYESNQNLHLLKEKIRHIYDIIKLLESSEIQELVTDKDRFFNLIKDVQNDDQQNQEFQGEWSIKPLHKAILFSDSSKVLNELEDFYTDNFKTLLFEDETLPSLSLITTKLERITALLKEYDNLETL